MFPSGQLKLIGQRTTSAPHKPWVWLGTKCPHGGPGQETSQTSRGSCERRQLSTKNSSNFATSRWVGGESRNRPWKASSRRLAVFLFLCLWGKGSRMSLSPESPSGKEGSPGEGFFREGSEAELRALCAISPQTVKHVLELLCDESGFLIESKLRGLLQPLKKRDRTLMRLDSIFTALSIDHEEDVFHMVEFFMNFKAQQVAVALEKEAAMAGTASTEATVEGDTEEEEEEAEEEEEEEEKEKETETTAASVALPDEKKGALDSATSLSSLSMHPNDILKALKAFVQAFREPREKHPQVKNVPEERDISQDTEYWSALAHVISDGELKLWDALIVGLQRYYHILTQRSKLITETSDLHQQNAELRVLLQQYLQSPVNAELLIPPTHLLHLQMNKTD